ncbi:MAG: class I SAM-dependent methyltransferase [Candidatus Hydrogenedentes bacterium]|nr:class I SAM-dependent methyltransferase [Candidatus Hydrogenedentota bacterium]
MFKRLLRPLADGVGKLPLVRGLVGRELGRVASEPWSAAVIDGFVNGPAGAAYGVGAADKLGLVEQFRGVNSEIESGTSPLVHVVLAREILSIPPDVRGDVIECGVWKGASSSSLSLVCSKVGRTLVVCDSFEGLPGDDGMRVHVGPHVGVYGYYKKGMFAGSLDEVRENIRRCGSLETCRFVKGLFSESLRGLDGPLAFAFLDVDLVSSTRDCLRHIWPRLVENGAVYTDDAGDRDIVKVYFDEAWWRQTLGCEAPGLVGSGCGLPLNPTASSLGYTRKMTAFDPAMWRKTSFLYYPKEP